ncbi:hypothetical protein WJX72_011511 [[Myrmecia] bisecta]|uniref:DNA repair protein RAD51 homolog 3 n=1 Tax=[Myrmecia] bisecta TaxID=41462 RepID=A0AAW1PXU2_9CHLO
MAGPRLEVLGLALAPGLRHKLQCAGFRTSADLEGIGPVDLAREVQITPEEALLVLKVASVRQGQQGGITGARSAQQLYEREAAAKRIITFCPELDQVLGGGIASGQITEFCGVPGVGKTQLGIQLAVDVQIPEAFGGLAGSAVYIDTEGSFMVERAVEIADACCRHLQRSAANSGDQAKQQSASALSRDSMLANIHYFRVRDHVEQLAALQTLPNFLQQHPQVRLIVIDSITFHFRQDFQDMALRTRILAQMAQQLMQLAEDRDVAVVLMNQVTTKISGDDQTRLVPALGDSWAHAATSRVILFWQDQTRCAFIYKSPYLPARTAQFHITPEGVRGKRPQKRARPKDVRAPG